MTTADTPTAIAQIEHIALRTTDIQRLRDFYTHNLGAAATPPTTDGNDERPCSLDLCGVRLELIHAREPGPREPQRHRLAQIGFALGSANAVDHLTARLAAAGHHVIEPAHRSTDGRYHSAVLDPDGNHLELTV
jgi:lactoylglutathione lyase